MDQSHDKESASGQIAGLAQQIASLTQQVAGLMQKIAALAQQKVSSDQQIAGLLQQIAGQAQQISAMQSRITNLELQNAALTESTTKQPLKQLSIETAAGCSNGIATPLNTASIIEDCEMSGQSTRASAAAATSAERDSTLSLPSGEKPKNRASADAMRKESKSADDDISLFPDDSIMDVLQPEKRQSSREAALDISSRSPRSFESRRRSEARIRHSRSPSSDRRRSNYSSRYRGRFSRSRSRNRSRNRSHSRGRGCSYRSAYGRGRSTSSDRKDSYGRPQSSNFGHRRRRSHSRDHIRTSTFSSHEASRDCNKSHNQKTTQAADSNKVHGSKWLVVDSACAGNNASTCQDLVMPTSVKQLSGESTSLSSYDKVCAWQHDLAKCSSGSGCERDDKQHSSERLSSRSPIESQRLRRPSQSKSDNSLFVFDASQDDSLGAMLPARSKPALSAAGSNSHGVDTGSMAAKSDNSPGMHDSDYGGEDDEDDEDSDNPLNLLRSRSFSAKSLFQLTDGSGLAVTADRLGMLWSICAWLPLDSLDAYYERMFRTDLYSNNSRAQIKGFVKALDNFAERKVNVGHAHQTLIFKPNSHLKRLSNNQCVFIWSPVPEPVLFYYLVTTVLQPLSIYQGDTIVKLWKDEFGRSPVGLTTVKDQHGAGWTTWEDIGTQWKAAIDWLCSLAYQIINLGKPYLIKKLTNWDGKISNICANAQWKNALHACNDMDAALVFGLTRDELVALLGLTPILLSNILSREDIDGLEGELDLA